MATGVTQGAAAVREQAGERSRRLRAPGRGALLAILGLLALLQMLFWFGLVASKPSLDAYASTIDLAATLTGARIIRDGDGARLYDLETQRAAQARVLAPSSKIGISVGCTVGKGSSSSGAAAGAAPGKSPPTYSFRVRLVGP